jgi:type II secretory ATPase GspE/PulE/Tfp pilus assembly ATPase PilB-like protein
MYEHFTQRSRKVMTEAKQEARRMHHNCIGTEHILLGIVREGGIAATLLQEIGVDLGKIPAEVEAVVKSRKPEILEGDLSPTPQAKKVIEYALAEARKLKCDYVGTEHLLLGLIQVRDGAAAQVLQKRGQNLDCMQTEVYEKISHEPAIPPLAEDSNHENAQIQEQYLKFWNSLAEDLAKGNPLDASLKSMKEKMASTLFDPVLDDLINKVNDGVALSTAMEFHESFFPSSMVYMVRAGEAGGVLGVTTKRLVDGIAEGSFPVPGVTEYRTPVMARFWQAFGLLLGSGVPIIEVLNVLAEDYAVAGLTPVIDSFKQAVLNGRPMSDVLREFPEYFSLEICDAVEAGEQTGNLDEQARKIADTIKRGNYEALVSGSVPVCSGENEAGACDKFVESVIEKAVVSSASDIHFDPAQDGSLRVRYRIDGVLHDQTPIASSQVSWFLNRLKMLAKMEK